MLTAELAAELAAVDAAWSRFRRDSELWRVSHARGRPVAVSRLFADALATALDAAELTGGDVDPTCGQSLVRLGYDRDFARNGRSFSAEAPGGEQVLVAVEGLAEGPAVIRAFVPGTVLRHGVARAWLLLGGVGLLLLLLSVVVADQLARSLVRPLTALAQAADRLAGGELSARATVAGPPEVRRAGAGLNRLAVRIGELLAHERETVADLSHRLRTPLTALKIDAESLRDGTGPTARAPVRASAAAARTPGPSPWRPPPATRPPGHARYPARRASAARPAPRGCLPARPANRPRAGPPVLWRMRGVPERALREASPPAPPRGSADAGRRIRRSR